MIFSELEKGGQDTVHRLKYACVQQAYAERTCFITQLREQLLIRSFSVPLLSRNAVIIPYAL